MSAPLAGIIYIAFPESLERSIDDFQIDPTIRIPIDTRGDAETFDVTDLSWEQILAGMLKILAYEPSHKDADYYRDFTLAVNPGIINELTETAIIKARNGDLDLAEEIFLALRGLQPDDLRPVMNLALLYEQRADSAKSLDDEDAEQSYIDLTFELYGQILSKEDVYPEAHLNAGFFYVKQSAFDRALASLSHFVDHSDNEEQVAEAQTLIAEISSQNLVDTVFKEAFDFIQMGREEEGIEKARQFLQAHSDVWNGWFLLGWGLRRLERYQDARAAFEKALELGPRQTDTLNELAICHMESGDTVQAEALLKEALLQEPENIKVISNLGIVAMKEENTDEAAGYFRTVLEIEPEDRLAHMYLEQLSGE